MTVLCFGFNALHRDSSGIQAARSHRAGARAFTLIEMLVVVTMLGIAGVNTDAFKTHAIKLDVGYLELAMQGRQW